MHYRIFEIETQLKHAVAIATTPNATGTIQLGSTVILEVSGSGAPALKKTFQILGPQETDPARGRISHLSPLGAALIGHAKGEIVEVKTGNGLQTYRIVEIR
jgi:transcription elongation factor GreA